MTEDKNREILPSKGGIFSDLALRIKLIMRLLADGRVNPLLKLLPIGSLLYFLIPDLAPGPIDDVAIIWVGTFLFVELCPPDVVQEHMATLRGELPAPWRDANADPDQGDIIEGEFWEKQD